MPEYFFHLFFELHSSRSAADTTFIPPPKTNIFTAELPAHRQASWSSTAPVTRAYSAAAAPSSRHLSHRTRASSSVHHHESPVPVDQDPTKGSSHTSHQSFAAHQDWRFDTVSIISIDMLPSSSSDTTRQTLKQAATSGGLATKGKFIPSNPKSTEVGWGVVHLFRDGKETPGLYDEAEGACGPFVEDDCTTLCILAVPSYMTPSDLLGFVGEKTREDVSHFRLIRTSRANKYMVLVKFRDPTKARKWRKEWNGKTFNSMEPEYCHVVFVKSINFQDGDSSTRDPSSYPDLTNDPFTPAASQEPTATLPPTSSASQSTESSSLATSLTTKPYAPPTPALIELPTCPVCLERMDETTGLLTILCQHVFHCACLEKWRGSGCPVCRYTQNDAFTTQQGLEDDAENICKDCGATENLWICVICGNIGCGRYDEAHAFAHYKATKHTYAMDVVTQHVWDYAGDGYVHRLIQNKADGKLVDLPASTQQTGMTGYANDNVPREKLDNMGMEYAYLLTSQLESQRAYFEEQLAKATDKSAKAVAAAEEASRTASTLAKEFKALQVQHMETLSTISALEKESAKNTQKATVAQELANKLNKQYKEEKTVNESLLTRIKHCEKVVADAEAKVKQLEAQKADLEDQNNDLVMYISGEAKVKEMKEKGEFGLEEGELESGTLEVGKKKGKGKGKKKA
ncbi:RING-10 protein [Didymella exigua CBS 183.55]|uniref:RING-10 protein n=1 Tax=Didymella exigua CBS 183.55 TaxID=1150837 RepID=A0A6A5RT12_9PLEO|nr:RING-10 protein [Didymella exigua CBS 183.55]KAF1930118.1 RING-10 protein [Didymella exigua CBS 183.55]